MKDIISAGLDRLALSDHVPDTAAQRLADYGRLLLEKNQVMNLTAIRDEAGVAQLHMLDCAALEYVSSAGLRVILKAQKLMNAQGAMKLTHVNEAIMEVFDITGFADILTIV